MDGLSREGDPAFQQEAANLVDQRRAALVAPQGRGTTGLSSQITSGSAAFSFQAPKMINNNEAKAA